MRAAYCRYTLDFIQPAVTSRDVMSHKPTFFLKLWHEGHPETFGIGECALFKGLGADDRPDYINRLAGLCKSINSGKLPDSEIYNWSSICFGYETAIRDLNNGGIRQPFPSAWSKDATEIAINGLIWMGNKELMFERIKQKLAIGFRCIKLKIGGVDFNDELQLLQYIRSRFSPSSLEIRLDANGAFSPGQALKRLDALSVYHIHSIEQPIRQHQWNDMRYICANSPIPIALDEELIGINTESEKESMLTYIKPAYIILKPSLCGGFSSADNWIRLAQKHNIGWWATSALESNIGLNAIAQWVSVYQPTLPQGLGTGALYSNNITSPVCQERDVIKYNPAKHWIIPDFSWIEP